MRKRSSFTGNASCPTTATRTGQSARATSRSSSISRFSRSRRRYSRAEATSRERFVPAASPRAKALRRSADPLRGGRLALRPDRPLLLGRTVAVTGVDGVATGNGQGTAASYRPPRPFREEARMSIQLGATAPDFQAKTTDGPIEFHDWIGDSWAV